MTKEKAIKKPKPLEKRKRGRALLDVDALRVRIFYEAPKGLTEERLATFLGISHASYFGLKVRNIDFLEAVKHYKRVSPLEVLASFKKLAVGYTVDETKKELKKNKATGEMEMTVTEITTKHIAPNATAGIFYLKNQMPEEFKDKIENTHTFNNVLDNITFVIKAKE